MKKLLLVFTLLIAVNVNAQQWVSTYHNLLRDNGTAITADPEGNSYVLSTSRNYDSSYYATLIKYTTSGVQQWIQPYAPDTGSVNIYPIGIAYSAGFIYVMYDFQNSPDANIITIKYNLSGEQQWIRIFDKVGQVSSNRIIADHSGNIIIQGTYNSGIFTLKYNPSGDILWTNYYPGAHCTDYTIDLKNNLYLTGFKLRGGGRIDYFTLKLSSSGDTMWSATNNQALRSVSNSICLDNTGSVYITGNAEDESGHSKISILKYTEAGSLVWVRLYESPGDIDDFGSRIASDNFGNVIISGETISSSGISSIVFLKYNSAGSLIWDRNYMHGNVSYGYSMRSDDQGNCYLAGATYSSGSEAGLVLVYDPSGNIVFEDIHSSGIQGNYFYDLALDAKKDIHITGTVTDSLLIGSCITLKYSSPVSVSPQGTEVPSAFALMQNFPNPFNPSTSIEFNIAEKGFVKLSVFDILGREVEVIVNENLDRGQYRVSFDGTGLNSGIYFYKLETGNFKQVKKMSLIK